MLVTSGWSLLVAWKDSFEMSMLVFMVMPVSLTERMEL